MHMAEAQVGLPPGVVERSRLPEWMQQRYPSSDGYVQWEDPGQRPLADAWAKVAAEADRRGWVRKGTFGAATALLFPARAMVGLYADWLRTDPYGLFGLTAP